MSGLLFLQLCHLAAERGPVTVGAINEGIYLKTEKGQIALVDMSDEQAAIEIRKHREELKKS